MTMKSQMQIMKKIYLEVANSFTEDGQKSLNAYFRLFGPFNFMSSFIKVYEDVYVKGKHIIKAECVQTEFLTHLEEYAIEYANLSSFQSFEFTAWYAKNVFGCFVISALDDEMLYDIWLRLKEQGCSEADIVSKFKQIQDLINENISYEEWRKQLSSQ